MAAIIFLSGIQSGGAEKVTAEICNDLVKNTSNQIVLVSLVYGEPFYDYDSRVICYSPEYSLRKKNKISTVLNLIVCYFKIIRFIRKLEPIGIIGFLPINNIFAILVAKYYNISSIICCRNNPIHVIIPLYQRILRKFTYRHANLIILQNRMTAELFTSINVVIPKYKVLRNPIDRHFFDTMYSKKLKSHKIILNVGSLSLQKGHNDLLNIFSELDAPEYKLVIVGDGPLKNELMELAIELGVHSRVVFAGRQKNIKTFYQQANIFAFTSRFEGFPNALAEAVICGLPSISYNCVTGPSEIIDDGKTGFLIECFERDTYLNKLQVLVSDNLLREEFSKNTTRFKTKMSRNLILKEWRRTIHDTFDNGPAQKSTTH